ncbi:MAG: cytochrome c oxidase assembly protein [Proteobacteria bacterium]|nr:cytochrome c oxidase assembly protein [Pseudomonadota bacterium]
MDSMAAGRRLGGGIILAWALLAWAAIALVAGLLPDSPGLLHSAPWEVWPLDPAIAVPLVLCAAVYLRGARSAPAPSAGRQAAFLGAIAALTLALQSPIFSMASRSFALDAVGQMLLRTVAPALLAMAAPMEALRRGVRAGNAQVAGAQAPPSGALWAARRGAHRALRALADGLSRPLPATALYVGTAYVWAWPAARDGALLDPWMRGAMDLSFVLSGLAFFRALFDLRAEPAGPTIGTRLLMVWGAELGNILLGYFLTYTSLPLYRAYAAHGLLWGLTPLANQMYGGQTLWLCDTAMIGVAAMVVIFRWAREEDRLRGPRLHPGTDRAAWLARQRASNRRVVLGLLGFVAMIVGIMGASVVLYEVTYHRAVAHAPAVSVNQIP